MLEVGGRLVAALEPFTPPPEPTRVNGLVLLANGITVRANAVDGQIRRVSQRHRFSRSRATGSREPTQ